MSERENGRRIDECVGREWWIYCYGMEFNCGGRVRVGPNIASPSRSF